MDQVVDSDHLSYARLFRRLYAAHREHEDLLSIGAYQHGSNQDVDMAIALWPKISEFLRQEATAPCGLGDSLAALAELFTPTAAPDSSLGDTTLATTA